VIDSTFTSAHKVGVADVNGDGSPDIVTSEQAAGRRASVFYTDGSGNFSAKDFIQTVVGIT
jgi:hypothetical protein